MNNEVLSQDSSPVQDEGAELGDSLQPNPKEEDSRGEQRAAICSDVARTACASCVLSSSCPILELKQVAITREQAPERASYLDELMNEEVGVVVAGYREVDSISAPLVASTSKVPVAGYPIIMPIESYVKPSFEAARRVGVDQEGETVAAAEDGYNLGEMSDEYQTVVLSAEVVENVGAQGDTRILATTFEWTLEEGRGGMPVDNVAPTHTPAVLAHVDPVASEQNIVVEEEAARQIDSRLWPVRMVNSEPRPVYAPYKHKQPTVLVSPDDDERSIGWHAPDDCIIGASSEEVCPIGADDGIEIAKNVQAGSDFPGSSMPTIVVESVVVKTTSFHDKEVVLMMPYAETLSSMARGEYDGGMRESLTFDAYTVAPEYSSSEDTIVRPSRTELVIKENMARIAEIEDEILPYPTTVTTAATNREEGNVVIGYERLVLEPQIPMPDVRYAMHTNDQIVSSEAVDREESEPSNAGYGLLTWFSLVLGILAVRYSAPV